MAELTEKQKNTMKKHSVHHTKKHMKFMNNKMKQGMSFTKAHKLAMKKVGE
tara:strand:- start:1230 stop:1382 length:153 start_codon:yes stop_codon:yes gene_type:complete